MNVKVKAFATLREVMDKEVVTDLLGIKKCMADVKHEEVEKVIEAIGRL